MTSPFNPYDPPGADELELRARASGASARLASLGQRWLAATIDALLMVFVVAPLQYKAGLFAKFPAVPQLSFKDALAWAAIGFAIWGAQNGYFLATNSQTIGKRLVGIRIEDMAGGRTAWWKIVLVRQLPFSCIANVPGIGIVALADILLIFRKDRRCLHDRLAGTQVVRVR